MSDSYTDLELLQASADGDREAFAQLYDRYERPVYGMAFRVLQDVQLAEDVVRDVFLRIRGHKPQDVSVQGRVGTRLLQLTRARALDVRKLLGLMPEPSQPVERKMLQGAEHDVIQSALAELNEDQRNVIRWMHAYGLTQQEISERYEIPLAAVKSRARLALNRLRQRLVREPYEQEGRADEHVHTPVRSH